MTYAAIAGVVPMHVWNLERSVDPEEALSRIEKIIADLGLRADFELIDSRFMVSSAVLYDEHDVQLATAAGKGRFARCGALAELLEHWASSLRLARSPRTVMPARKILEQPALEREGIVQSCRDLDSLPLVVQEFRSVRDGQPCFLPCQLIYPSWTPLEGESAAACERLARYGTNSGCAFGLTLHDALLHGLNEVIERHVVSQLYLQLLELPSDAQFRELPAQAWPEEPRELGGEVESRYDAQIELLIADSGFSTWCAIAIARSKSGQFALPQLGSGSSLFPELAVCRAVAELAQCCVFSSETPRRGAEAAIGLARDFRSFEPVVYLAPGAVRYPVLDRLPHAACEALPPERQWARIRDALQERGYAACTSELARLGADGVIAQVFVPGLEQFHLIREGNVVAPQAFLLADSGSA
jgi:ribosomal protein S12 methylthiotransferase accessory factor